MEMMQLRDKSWVTIPDGSVINRCPNRDLEIVYTEDGVKWVTIVNGNAWAQYTAKVVDA